MPSSYATALSFCQVAEPWKNKGNCFLPDCFKKQKPQLWKDESSEVASSCSLCTLVERLIVPVSPSERSFPLLPRPSARCFWVILNSGWSFTGHFFAYIPE